MEESCKTWESESVLFHSYPQSISHSYLNCPILAESGLYNGSFQAFMTRRLGREEKLSALPSSLPPSQQISSSSLIGLLYFFAELCLNPVPSYLASNHPTSFFWCQVWRKCLFLSLSLFPAFQTPVWTHVSHSGPSLYSRKDSYWDSYCLFALFMLLNSLRANGSIMQSFTFAVLSVLLSISLMMFSLCRWVPCLLKSRTWELGRKGGRSGETSA